jgi:hypothetical protein
MHLKALGFDNDEIRHRVVAYCPQVRVQLVMVGVAGVLLVRVVVVLGAVGGAGVEVGSMSPAGACYGCCEALMGVPGMVWGGGLLLNVAGKLQLTTAVCVLCLPLCPPVGLGHEHARHRCADTAVGQIQGGRG